MLTPEFQPRALYDLESIIAYLSVVLKSPRAAESWKTDLTDTVDLLCHQPEQGHIFREERLVVQERRMFLIGNYRMFYSFDKSTLTIWRIIHATQDMDDYALIDL